MEGKGIHRNRELLLRLKGRNFLDVRVPERGFDRDSVSGGAVALAIGLVVEGVETLFISVRSIDLQKQAEAFVLDATEVFPMLPYPGGAEMGWESLSDIASSVAGKIIEGIGILVSPYDVSSADNSCIDMAYEVEEGLVFHLSDGGKLVIEASDMPLWLELGYGTGAILESAIGKKRGYGVFAEKPVV